MQSNRKETIAQFVTESNRLANETAGKGHLSYINHTAAACLVWDEAPKRYVSPREIHYVLMKGIESCAGKFRTNHPVVYEEDLKEAIFDFPDPQALPGLMFRHEAIMRRVGFMGSLCTEREKADLAQYLMLQGLCILPFLDGNRRTYRLVHNMIRLSVGLPWKVFHSNLGSTYDREIKEVRVASLV